MRRPTHRFSEGGNVRKTVITAAAIAAAVVGASAGPADAATPPHLNPHASISTRVHDLLGRMTLDEKIGQMDQIVVGALRAKSDPGDGTCNGGNDAQPQESCLQRVLVQYNVGSILSGGTDNPPQNTGR